MRSFLMILLITMFVKLNLFAQESRNEIIVNLNSTGNVVLDTNSLKKISDISLQALTPDTSVVGYISDTLSNATYSLVPQTQLSNWLQSYVDNIYDPIFSDTGKHVYWVIKNFNLSESISTNNVYVHIGASIFANSLNNSNAYWEIDTVLQFPHPPANDYSIPFENSIQTLITYSANKIALSGNSSLKGQIGLRRNNPRTLRDFSDLPIIHDSIVNEGAFLTLGQLANNNPSVTNIFILADSISTNGAVHIYHQNDDSTVQEITSLVALCIGGELYAYRNNRIIAIERTNNSMLISRYRDPDARTNQAMYMRMTLRYSLGNENPFSKEYRCTKAGYQDVIATCVDLDTGDLSF